MSYPDNGIKRMDEPQTHYTKMPDVKGYVFYDSLLCDLSRTGKSTAKESRLMSWSKRRTKRNCLLVRDWLWKEGNVLELEK